MLHSTHRNMELIDVLLILGMFLPVFFVGIWQLNRLNPIKKSLKAGDSSIKEMYGVYNQQVTDVLKVKDKQISSLSAKLRNYDEDEQEDEPNQKQVTFEEIQALVKTKYPKQAILLPLIRKQVMDATKGMTMEEILGYVKQFTGNQESQGSAIAPDAAGNVWRSDYA